MVQKIRPDSKNLMNGDGEKLLKSTKMMKKEINRDKLPWARVKLKEESEGKL